MRLLRKPEAVITMLAAFETIEQAGQTVAAIIAAGLTPAAAEIMDALAITAAEKAVDCGYPAGAGAVLIVEVDGPADEVAAEHAAVEELCRANGAFEVRTADRRGRARDAVAGPQVGVRRGRPDQRRLHRAGRRRARAPRWPTMLGEIEQLAADHGVQVANVFHAGDGNLHPLVLFDGTEPGALEAAEHVSNTILERCVAHGGSITGEHGVGIEKAPHMATMFSPADLDMMNTLRCAFDPDGLANPGKVFPTPRMCGEPRRRPSSDTILGEVSVW